MKLYEMARDFAELYDNDMLLEEEPDAWFDTLTMIEDDFDHKAENIIVLIKSMTADAEELKAERQKLEQRQKVRENTVKRLKEYLLNTMQMIGRAKVESSKGTASVRKSPAALVIEDERRLMEYLRRTNDDLLRYRDPEFDKTAIKEALKDGKEIPFCHMDEDRKGLIIK